MWPFSKRQTAKETPDETLEAKLDALAECGIQLKPEFSIADLLSSWDRTEYEEPGYNMTLVGLGMTQETPPWKPRTKNLWHFDTECIEGDGSYADLANRMVEMAEGSLPITAVEDHVDIEEGEAWLSFKLDGKAFKIPCEVNDDWVDHKVFRHFVRLLAETDPAKIYFYYDLGGQDCIIGCVSRDNYKKLSKLIPTVSPLN